MEIHIDYAISRTDTCKKIIFCEISPIFQIQLSWSGLLLETISKGASYLFWKSV